MQIFIKIFPLAIMFFLIASCGGDYGSSGSSYNPPQQQQADQGTYVANLTTVNAGVGGNAAAGSITINVTTTNFNVQMNMNGTPARMMHVQNITTASSCPTTGADVNADRVIDVQESLSVTGRNLIPLDGDLNSQAGGINDFPDSDGTGAYSYNESANLQTMLTDLRLPDPVSGDSFTKLAANENLNLSGRAVIVHGVPLGTSLPSSAQTVDGAPVELTVPIACGVLSRQ